MNKTIKALDEVLAQIDTLLSGKQNVIFKTDLNELRNFVVELQEKYENI